MKDFILPLAAFLAVGYLMNSCGISGCYYQTDAGEECEHHGY